MIYERIRDPARESIKQSPRSAAAGMRLVRSTAALQNEPIASSAPEATESRLIHLSSRAMVTPTSGPIIVGFTLSGSGPSRVLLRAAGPALAELGVTNWLVYPRIQLFDTAGEIILESTKDEVTHLGLSPWTGRAEGLPFRPTSTDAMRILALTPSTSIATRLVAAESPSLKCLTCRVQRRPAQIIGSAIFRSWPRLLQPNAR